VYGIAYPICTCLVQISRIKRVKMYSRKSKRRIFLSWWSKSLLNFRQLRVTETKNFPWVTDAWWSKLWFRKWIFEASTRIDIRWSQNKSKSSNSKQLPCIDCVTPVGLKVTIKSKHLYQRSFAFVWEFSFGLRLPGQSGFCIGSFENVWISWTKSSMESFW
jgi:hypothetical protein